MVQRVPRNPNLMTTQENLKAPLGSGLVRVFFPGGLLTPQYYESTERRVPSSGYETLDRWVRPVAFGLIC